MAPHEGNAGRGPAGAMGMSRPPAVGAEVSLTAAICTRGRPDELRRALASLGGQADAANEIVVVVNDRDDERSVRLVRDEFPGACCVIEPAPGVDFARNRALRTTTSDVVAFLDDDAVASPSWAGAIRAVFARDPSVGVCTGRVLPLALETEGQKLFEANGGFGRGDATIRLPRLPRRARPGGRLPFTTIGWAVSVGSGASYAVRRSLALELGGFDEALDLGSFLPGGGDHDMLYRVLLAGASVVYEPTALARHEHRREKEAAIRQIVGHQRGLVAMLAKHAAAGRGSFPVALYLGWRLVKPGVRLVRRAAGREPAPGAGARADVGHLLGRDRRLPRRARRVGTEEDRMGVTRGETRAAGAGLPRRFLAGAAGRVLVVRDYRFLLRGLVIRDLKVKYKRSALGFVWTFLNPLLMTTILIAVFRVVIRIPVPHYWAFLLSGYFVWNTAQQMIMAGSFILQEHGQLTRSVAFPKEILLFGAALSRLVEFAVEILLILVVLAVAHHHGVPVGFVFLPLLVVILTLLSVGIMLPVATAATLFSDVQHALPVVLASLFYLTPVFYPIDMVPERFRALYLLNPFAGLLTLFRQALYEGRVPDFGLLVHTGAVALAVFFAGYAIFHRYQEVCNELA